jgi:hypothetical protein
MRIFTEMHKKEENINSLITGDEVRHQTPTLADDFCFQGDEIPPSIAISANNFH